MLVNIAWNHSGWTRLEPNPHVGFGFTKHFNKGALSPHEALNFDFRKKDIDSNDTVYGYFQTRGVPRRFASGGVIFFWSRSTDDGKADVLDPIKKWKYPGFETGEFWANILGGKRLSCLFPCPVHDSAYKTDGKKLIGRANFTYNFDKGKALKLLYETKNKSCGGDSNSGAIATLTAIEECVRDKL